MQFVPVSEILMKAILWDNLYFIWMPNTKDKSRKINIILTTKNFHKVGEKPLNTFERGVKRN